MAASAPVCDFGWPAPDFALPGTDGKVWRRSDVLGARGLLVAFICNHCPYVQAILDRFVRDAAELKAMGIGVVAISSNDVAAYPQDGFSQMKVVAQQHGFAFPYLYDESQAVAKAFGAACTPDFFGFNAELKLQYRGRLDASGRAAGPVDAPRELFDAMCLIANTGVGPERQVAAIGCSIKWKA